MSEFTTVLAVETSTKACSVALINQGKEFSRHEILPQKHAHRVLEMVDEVLQESTVAKADIDLLAYGEGPGAFTGIRIASGVIQGLALGLNKPVSAISSLSAMAEDYFSNNSFDNEQAFACLLDARMSEVYLLLGSFDNNEFKLEPVAMVSPAKAEQLIREFSQASKHGVIGIGDIENEYSQLTACFDSYISSLPKALSIARLALKQQAFAKNLEQMIPEPVYLRNQVADTIEQRKQKQQA